MNLKTIGDLSSSQLSGRLQQNGLCLQTGPFSICVKSPLASVAQHIEQLYPGNPYLDEKTSFIDFHISLLPATFLHRWIKPQVRFLLDGYQVFTPLPINQAAAQFEWGLNWCIASQMHQYLIIHAAVVEKDGVSLILPGSPGSGKSTLSAGLTGRGWRLLSDEMALISVDDLTITPSPRPVSLKNQSIDIISQYLDSPLMGSRIKGTLKGDICHLASNDLAISNQLKRCDPALILFPKYRINQASKLNPIKKASAAMSLIENSFNFNILGTKGFNTITRIIDRVDSFLIEYPDLDTAISLIDQIIERHGQS